MKRLKLLADERGMGAVEFAILSPILILMLLGIIVGAAYAAQLLDTRAAVQAGAKYVLQGGSDNSTIQAVAVSSWANKPSDGVVTVNRYCTCGAAINTCSSLCTISGRPPDVYVEIKASADWDSPLKSAWSPSGTEITQQQVIRVR